MFRFSVCGVLGIVFIVLKLVGTISWSWWWVLSPFWVPWAIFWSIIGVLILLKLILD